jgi:hypothetical protein
MSLHFGGIYEIPPFFFVFFVDLPLFFVLKKRSHEEHRADTEAHKGMSLKQGRFCINVELM